MLVFEERGKPEFPEKNLSEQGPVSRKPRKLFGPGKPWQNLEPYDYRAVLFTYWLNMKRGSLLTRSFRRLHFSVFGYR